MLTMLIVCWKHARKMLTEFMVICETIFPGGILLDCFYCTGICVIVSTSCTLWNNIQICACSSSLPCLTQFQKCDSRLDNLAFVVPLLRLCKVNSKLSSNISVCGCVCVFLWVMSHEQSYVKHACAQQGHLCFHLQFDLLCRQVKELSCT